MTATTRSAATVPSLPASDREGASLLRSLLRLLAKAFTPERRPGIEEQYLAQAVDASDLQVRLAALERARP